MKYVVIDQRNTEIFTEEFETKAEAIGYALRAWSKYMTDSEKKNCTEFYVLESVNSDPDAEDHLDGDVILDFLKDVKPGTQYSDPDGDWEVIEVSGDDVTVRNIQPGNLNEGQEAVVLRTEVLYYLEGSED